MKKLLPLLVLGLIVAFQYLQQNSGAGSFDGSASDISGYDTSADQPSFVDDSNWRSGNQVRGNGTVERVLSDDNDGSRHQRFILRLTSGRSVLIAHNIDLAPRVESISTGDVVSFYGQFESNDRGGVIHWTHRDPQGRHAHGWLQHRGRKYE
ncbi:MAG: DUF3465 domain-containing protein [Gammaproteobacteria bacterium]|nr:DUF3465 domain-containing protein [Gammaproteobacteria bacterium]